MVDDFQPRIYSLPSTSRFTRSQNQFLFIMFSIFFFVLFRIKKSIFEELHASFFHSTFNVYHSTACSLLNNKGGKKRGEFRLHLFKQRRMFQCISRSFFFFPCRYGCRCVRRRPHVTCSIHKRNDCYCSRKIHTFCLPSQLQSNIHF